MKLLVVALLACTACSNQRGPAQLVTLPPGPAPGPWQTMRAALDSCARTYGLAGELQVRVTLNDAGRVIAVDAAHGDGFAGCVGNATLRERYRKYASRTLLIAFTAGA